jgi:hypothetical protein
VENKFTIKRHPFVVIQEIGERSIIIRVSIIRAVPSAIIGGGGGDVYTYICVLPDGFLLKAIVFTVCEHEYMNIPPPPIIASRNGPVNNSSPYRKL